MALHVVGVKEANPERGYGPPDWLMRTCTVTKNAADRAILTHTPETRPHRAYLGQAGIFVLHGSARFVIIRTQEGGLAHFLHSRAPFHKWFVADGVWCWARQLASGGM